MIFPAELFSQPTVIFTTEPVPMEELIRKSFPVKGMSCASCAVSVENILNRQEGVKQAAANYAMNAVWVMYNPEVTDPAVFHAALRKGGYDLDSEVAPAADREKARMEELKSLKMNTVWAAILAFPVMMISMFGMGIPFSGWIMLLLSTPVTFWLGRRFFINAFRLLKGFHVNMDTLVALSTGIAWAFSLFNLLAGKLLPETGQHHLLYFEASSVIIVFILFGRYLEERAKAGTTSAIRDLMQLQPDEAAIVDQDGRERRVPSAWIGVDDQVRIKPGERIPVDGVVLTGISSVDESSMTGESLPREIRSGDQVYAGTLNQKGSFVFSARKVGAETRLSRMVEAVKTAMENKPPLQKRVDKIASVFVPAVLVISLLAFALWLIFGGVSALPLAIRSMVSVLIIACPCALGLATPTAVMVGIGRGAAGGILIRDAAGLEKCARIDTLVFDKTGTITYGKPEVTGMEWLEESDRLKSILHGMELLSEHPLAEPVVKELLSAGNQPVMPGQFQAVPGKGITANYSGLPYAVGNEAMMQSAGADWDTSPIGSSTPRKEQETILWFAESGRIRAIISLSDRVKPTSGPAIEKLKQAGIEVHLLTGDHEGVARGVAEQSGITFYKANCLPGDKAAYITALKEKGRTVGMVGDGINDSEALALADVGMAMGSGSEISMDVSDMTLVTSDLSVIPTAIRLSKLTVRTIRQNLFWAFVYNVIAIPLAAGLLYPVWGFMLNPMIAGAAMALSSVSVVSNSLRLKYMRLG